MAQITIDIPEPAFKDFSKEEWEDFVKKAIKNQIKRIEESERFKEIITKSQATEKDVEELTKKADKAMIKHYSQYY